MQAEKLHKEYQVDVRVLGVVDSKRMLLSNTPMDLANWQEDLESKVRWLAGRVGGWGGGLL